MLPDKTYEITFYGPDGAPDSTQQYTEEAAAREAFRTFDEPDSAELYSRITLSVYDWETNGETELETLTF